MATPDHHPQTGQFVAVDYTPPPNGVFFEATMPIQGDGIPQTSTPIGEDPLPGPVSDPCWIAGADDNQSQ
jgi:hypothetical protein